MGERLAGGNLAVALIANTAATVAVLATLIALLGPLSGAHFNPAVSIVETLRGKLTAMDGLCYILTQIAGCCLGALLAHAMFELPLVQVSLHSRTGPAIWLSEFVATFGLLMVVLGHRRSGYAPCDGGVMDVVQPDWFTASTSFANPAITIARSLTNSLSGIRPVDAPGFILAELAGALIAFAAARLLFSKAKA